MAEFKCKACSASFPNEAELKAHAATHPEMRVGAETSRPENQSEEYQA